MWIIYLLSAALSIAAFENQRWVRARIRGVRGSSQMVGLFADGTGAVLMVFRLAFVVAIFYFFGWIEALAIIAISFGASLAWAAIARDSAMTWIIGTVAAWPLMGALGYLLWAARKTAF